LQEEDAKRERQRAARLQAAETAALAAAAKEEVLIAVLFTTLKASLITLWQGILYHVSA